ncbi:amidase [Bacillus sp. BGMRC 2118]|nr:amidase [Bacillus sp. BGMRC 2118]
MENILDYDASTLAQKIRIREITSLEATQTYIEHLNRINPSINCLVEDRFQAAIEEARRCDEQIESGNAKGKLFGVPISMKEAFDVQGMRTTGGLVSRKTHVATSDAVIVHKLKKEGAIILGKSNTPSLCFCQETDNKLYGRTNNPWDLNRTAGGSSGGEGALIAVGGASVGVGSDIGGSIRFPAHFNGVVGFRSGNKQVSQKGHFPYADHPFQEVMQGIGALAKSVDDAELIHRIISQQVGQKVDVTQFHLVIPDVHHDYPMTQETASTVNLVRNYFINQEKHSVEVTYPTFFTQLSLMWQLIMSIDGGESIRQVIEHHPLGVLKEFVKERVTKKSAMHSYLSWALIGARLFKPSKRKRERLRSDLEKAQEELQSYLHHKVLILPVYHSTALPHGKLYNEIFSIRKTFKDYMPYVSFANVLGLPALVVPIGEDRNGLPISVQLISLVGNEEALFYFGRKLESSFRGYVRCDLHD